MFRDKPSSVIYIEECLINPPTFPGAIKTLDYINELYWEFEHGKKTNKEISEIVGEIWGGSMIKVIIANAILASASLEGKKREIKAIAKVRETLMLQQENVVGQTKARWLGILDMKIVAGGAAKNFDFLLSLFDSNSVLGFELHVAKHIRSVRSLSVSNFLSTYICTQFEDFIFGLTGVKKSRRVE
jgi:hypothetical protein